MAIRIIDNVRRGKKVIQKTIRSLGQHKDEKDTEIMRRADEELIVQIKANADPIEILSRYRDLWRIEEAFRINKNDLKMRPIYHWRPKRIKAHIAICYIAFALLSYTRFKLNKAGLKISLDTLREELLHAQSSIVLDKTTKTYFSIPSKITENQKLIYKTFGLKRPQTPSILSAA